MRSKSGPSSPESLPPVQVDPNQLELTLLNLTVNARDAMQGGGAITISAREEHVTGANALGLSPGPFVCIRVEDTGAGMDEATLQRAKGIRSSPRKASAKEPGSAFPWRTALRCSRVAR